MVGQGTLRMGSSGVPASAPEPRVTFTGLLLGLYLSLFLNQFDLCMRLQGNLPFPPVYALLATLVIFSVSIWYFSPKMVGRIVTDCRGTIFCFATIAVMAIAGATLPDAELGEGGMNVIYPTLDFLLYLFAIPLATVFRSSKTWRIANSVALIGIVGSILMDAQYPGTFSSMESRAAGFGVNPNRGAAITAFLLVGALDWQRPRVTLSTCVWTMLALSGVFMTLSRSGVVLLGIVGTLYLRQCVRRNGIGTLVVLSGLVVSVGGYVLVAADAAKSTLPMFEGNNSRANLFNGELDAMDTSDDSRIFLIYEYLEMIAERPLTGHGTGFTESNEHGAHNIYLARWVDNGIVGLGAYLLFLCLLFRIGQRCRSWECVSTAIFVFVYGFFTHNLLEQKNVLLIMAIVAGRAVLNAPSAPTITNAVLRSAKMPDRARVPLAKAG